jgi:hypothetical protein
VNLRRRVAFAGRLSDSLIRLGPLNLGLDGVLSWIPGVGEIYGFAAAGYILGQGVRAGVPASVLALAGALMAGRTVISAIPLAGPAASDLLTLHRLAARLIVKDIDKRLEARGVLPEPLRGEALWRRRRRAVSA